MSSSRGAHNRHRTPVARDGASPMRLRQPPLLRRTTSRALSPKRCPRPGPETKREEASIAAAAAVAATQYGVAAPGEAPNCFLMADRERRYFETCRPAPVHTAGTRKRKKMQCSRSPGRHERAKNKKERFLTTDGRPVIIPSAQGGRRPPGRLD